MGFIMYSTIDTLQITKRLQGKGAKPELAEEFAEIMKEREQQSIENLATKDDLNKAIDSSKKDLKIFIMANSITTIAIMTGIISLFKIFN